MMFLLETVKSSRATDITLNNLNALLDSTQRPLRICILEIFLLLLLPPPPFYGHYIGQPVSHHHQDLLQDLLGAKFYCPHVLAEGN